MKIALFGVSGFIGKTLVQSLLTQGHTLHIVSTSPSSFQDLSPNQASIHEWNGIDGGNWESCLEECDGLINLSGAGVAAKRWSAARKKLILDSRVQSTQAIIRALQTQNKKIPVFVNASAVGYYGDVPEGDVTESTPAGTGFLAETCEKWEKEGMKAQSVCDRLVLVRIGVVLEKEGGALSKMIPPFQLFAGGPLGSGKQWFPWIHRDDVVGILMHALTTENLSGPVNGTAPNPLQLKEFCSELGKAMKRPSWAPVPSFMLKLLLGEMSDLLLTGQKVIPQKATQSGYAFKYPTAESALNAIFSK